MHHSPATSGAPSGARAVFLAWERLRLAYNAALLAVVTTGVLVLLPRELIVDRATWLVLAKGAIAANLLYFAGPLVEAYVDWLGFRHVALRTSMFAAGTAGSVLIAAAVLVSLLMPAF